MFLGVLFVLLACFCWSLVFVIPVFLQNFHPLEISLGRFFVYGLISFTYVLMRKRELFSRKYLPYWKKATFFAFLSTILCYTATLGNLQLSGPMMATLIFGMVPVCIALVGNFYEKEFPPQKLLLPLLLIVSGIFLAKFPGFNSSPSFLPFYLLGIFLGLIGLGAWTWFAVANSHFLKQQETLPIGNWTLMMGTATFFLVLLLGFFALPFSENPCKYFVVSSDIQNLFLGCSLLGILCTWVPFFLWNLGCKRIPISLSGQLMVFEILFALCLIYLLEHRLPSSEELIGIFLMFTGVLVSLKKLSSATE